MGGAAKAREELMSTDIDKNDCYKYAAIRNILYRKGKAIELLVSYEPSFTMMNEWWKQLFGESEGKDQKGLFPASVVFSTDLHSMDKKAFEGTVLAHTDGRVPNVILNMENTSETELGYLIYFFEKACAISGYTLGINPFNQPGVESYKKNMFALLGKPGYEDQKEALEARLK